MNDVKEELRALADEKYAEFQKKLVPTANPESIIGVRVPVLRAFVKRMTEERKRAFLSELPHELFEENLLHALIIGETKDFDRAAALTEEFLPYADNWAVTDILSLKCPRARLDDLYCHAANWCASDRVYTVRFGIVSMKEHFLDDFRPQALETVSRLHGDYYVDMAAGWFFCDALIKRFDETFPYFSDGRLDESVMKKAVRKAKESFRISAERKRLISDTLKTLRK